MTDMLDEGKINFIRQLDWFDPERYPEATVTILGAGGIGSPTLLGLAKLGIPVINVVDFDTVESHNIPNQMYQLSDAGEVKVEALAALGRAFGAPEINAFNGKAQDHPELLKGVVVTGFDNMYARKDVWEMVKNNPEVDLLVDARLGGQGIVILTIDPSNENHQKYYEDTYLFDQSEAVEAPCTARGVIDVSLQVASLIGRQVRRYYSDQTLSHTILFDQEDLVVDMSRPKKYREPKQRVAEALDTLND